MFRRIVVELFTPSNQSGPAHEIYDKSAQGVYHIVLGAVLIYCALFFSIPIGPFTIALLYMLFKETVDIRNGGELFDSIEDTLCVLAGALIYGLSCWPIITILIGITIMIKETIKNARRRYDFLLSSLS